MAKAIPLGGKCGAGKFAIVDDEDYSRVARISWHMNTGGYACGPIKVGKKYKIVKLHRFILSPAPDEDVDHINQNRLDNRRANLRACTTANNCKNRRGLSTKLKGAFYKKSTGRWQASITVNYKAVFLGYFDSEEAAARAYDAAAREYHGEFARLNFPS